MASLSLIMPFTSEQAREVVQMNPLKQNKVDPTDHLLEMALEPCLELSHARQPDGADHAHALNSTKWQRALPCHLYPILADCGQCQPLEAYWDRY